MLAVWSAAAPWTVRRRRSGRISNRSTTNQPMLAAAAHINNGRVIASSMEEVIGALRTEWVPVNKPKSSRNSFGEIDHSVIGRALATHGFISADAQWPVLSDDQRQEILAEKGLGGSDRFVESPEFKQQRIREMRRARRARRAAKTANA